MYCKNQLETIATENGGSLKVCWCDGKAKEPCFLGDGSYGAVRLGYWTNQGSAEKAVAVKSIITPNAIDYEIDILKTITHVNIVKLYFDMSWRSTRYINLATLNKVRFYCLKL